MKKPALGAVVLAAALSLTACSGGSPAAAHSLSAAGTVSVPVAIVFSQTDGSVDEPCTAGDGYTDINSGAQVVITDASGKTIGVGTLGDGTHDATPDSTTADRCLFPFAVKGLPAGSKFYGVHVGNQNRGVLQFRSSELKNIQLTIG
ncbi:hypothetical protein [Leifsonia sp. P73]|uniref:hypothetical protein n=1 Tax=Leifsonia sp. P73 TaxID=3423959 RepID=UPI003DA53A13